jgi:hypothetical protein
VNRESIKQPTTAAFTTVPQVDASKAKLDACRADFVTHMKRENSDRDSWCRPSLKAHWAGPRGGFASEHVQRRWNDYKDGWMAGRASA